MVEVRSGRGSGKFVGKGGSRLNSVLRNAWYTVHAIWYVQTVPVNGCGFRQLIGKCYLDLVALGNSNFRSGNLAIVGPCGNGFAVRKFPANWFSDQVKFFHAIVDSGFYWLGIR